MASRKTKGIPEDLINEILLWLPVKSLMRFKCVCKRWRDITRDPCFVRNHYLKRITLHQNEVCFILKRHFPESNNWGFSLMRSTVMSNRFTVTPNLFESECDLLVYGHCNGILCLCDEKLGSIYLWNPATRERKCLPLSNPPPDTKITVYLNHGFGFDSKTNDYKVISFLLHFVGEEERTVYRVELFSLKTGSWKEIPFDDSFHIPLPFPESPFYAYRHMDGVYYWRDQEWGEYILAFKMAEEVFVGLSQPYFYNDDCHYDYDYDVYIHHVDIAIFNGSLALIVCTSTRSDFQPRFVDIWVMTEYGVEVSWVKQVSLGPFHGVKRPLGFWMNDGLLFQGPDDEIFLLDNPNTEELVNLGLNRTSQFIEYVESLVPIS